MVRVDEKNVDSFCLTIYSLLQASNDAAELSKSPARKWQNIYSEKIEFLFKIIFYANLCWNSITARVLLVLHPLLTQINTNYL